MIFLHRALDQHGLAVTRLMGTDSAGGSYARALAVAMETDQLSHAFFSESAGLVNHNLGALAMRMLVKEGLINAKRNARITNDPEAMTSEKSARFGEAFARHAELPTRQALAEAKVGKVEALRSLATSGMALKQGPRGGENPLSDDTNAVIARHPNVHLTFGVAERDPLYRSTRAARLGSARLLMSLSLSNARVEVVFIPGMTHSYNTHFPGLYHAIERAALGLA